MSRVANVATSTSVQETKDAKYAKNTTPKSLYEDPPQFQPKFNKNIKEKVVTAIKQLPNFTITTSSIQTGKKQSLASKWKPSITVESKVAAVEIPTINVPASASPVISNSFWSAMNQAPSSPQPTTDSTPTSSHGPINSSMFGEHDDANIYNLDGTRYHPPEGAFANVFDEFADVDPDLNEYNELDGTRVHPPPTVDICDEVLVNVEASDSRPATTAIDTSTVAEIDRNKYYSDGTRVHPPSRRASLTAACGNDAASPSVSSTSPVRRSRSQRRSWAATRHRGSAGRNGKKQKQRSRSENVDSWWAVPLVASGRSVASAAEANHRLRSVSVADAGSTATRQRTTSNSSWSSTARGKEFPFTSKCEQFCTDKV